MKTVFYRIDERFIHAQLIHGWLPNLGARRVIGVSKKYAGDPVSIQTYLDAIPGEVMASVVAPLEAVKSNIGESDTERVIVLFSSLEDAVEYCRGGGMIKELNLGGIYPSADRVEYLPYIHLSDKELVIINELNSCCSNVYCQDTPHSERVELSNVLKLNENQVG